MGKYIDEKLDTMMDHNRNIDFIWNEVGVKTDANNAVYDYEIIDWVKSNTNGLYFSEIENLYIFYLFELEEDAMAFKLRWL